MTTQTGTDIKEVIFVNQDAWGEFKSLDATVQEVAHSRLTALQNGETLPTNHVRMLKGKLSGISEIRISHDTDTYRVYYAAEFDEVIFILDAGMKKSPRDEEIPQWQTERLVKRRTQAEKNHAANIGVLKERFNQRMRNRVAKDAVPAATK